MSLQCPYRHVSYATWRLQVFQTLYLSSSLEPQQPQCTLAPRSGVWARNDRRHHISFKPFGVSRTSETDTPSVQHEPASENENATKPRSRKASRRRGSFNPYSDEGLQRLKDLMPELKAFTEKVKYKAQPVGPVREDDTESIIPDSPIQKQVEKAARRRGIQKQRATYKELGPLKNNPFAEMLASPLRFCNGSGARLPADFMVDFDYVKSPVDGKTYLLPDKLADLDTLQEQMARELYKDDWRRVRDDKRAAREKREREMETTISRNSSNEDNNSALELSCTDQDKSHAHPSPSAPGRKSNVLLRIISNISLFRLMTLNLTKGHKNNPQKRTTRINEVQKLIPFESKEPLMAAQHYIRHKSEVNSAMGISNDSDPKGLNGLPINLKELQWQADIHVRLARIMRKRVSLCLTALAESESQSCRTGSDGQTCLAAAVSRRIVQLPIPAGGKIRSEDIRGLLSPTSSISVMPESPKGPESTPPTISATTSSPSSPHISQQQQQQQQQPAIAMSGKGFLLGHQTIPPGSILLHIGESDTSSLLSSNSSPADSRAADNHTTTRKTRNKTRSSLLPPLPILQSNPLIPPMLTVDNVYRFPVFPLTQLLLGDSSTGTETDEALRALGNALHYHRSPESKREKNSGTDSNDYLVLVRPGPGPARHLVREIWQLWRYLEGQSVLSLETDWSLEGEQEQELGGNRSKRGEEEDDDDDADDDDGGGGGASRSTGNSKTLGSSGNAKQRKRSGSR
ncbi:hypothetical protein HRR83_002882 [Exophiala dermatitidis]|nr:hypothetical protein HRR77_002900 [Exophiala dermatitidis]KAJ4572789.1 hypothetical protein HRR81_005229 [Exophiala dermatitidis]KAJ4601684.1 hypothetical protein HRR83_002882 [Exophiala dermatitidis]KAJ4601998.1 hypothetical protein HRR85_008894 [Exophiala dermatitidis]KAJ4673519.1 hypothetical protein HRR92_005230 [Exophiala dermatitidis]